MTPRAHRPICEGMVCFFMSKNSPELAFIIKGANLLGEKICTPLLPMIGVIYRRHWYFLFKRKGKDIWADKESLFNKQYSPDPANIGLDRPYRDNYGKLGFLRLQAIEKSLKN